MDRVAVISVVRDFDMYGRCVRDNLFVHGCELHAIDNTAKNEGIGVCYNRFLAGFDFSNPAWLVFCHEDFELKEDLRPHLSDLDKNALWGPIGAVTAVRFGVYHEWRLVGQVEQSEKDGSRAFMHGCKVPPGTPVETFDCQCLIVHSSLVASSNLRFDETLTFDLYAEDFCMFAAAKGIRSRILPFAARHWSGGNIHPRYAVQEAYINAKYPDVCFTGTSSWVLGGNPPFFRRLTCAAKRFALRLIEKKNG